MSNHENEKNRQDACDSKLSGFIAIDKPAGISSFDVIRRLRKITGIRKIGHTGTLDPFATGLLICCIGSYTRLAQYVEAEDKTYFATIQLGKQTNTGDTEGTVIQTADVRKELPDIHKLESTALELTELPIPAYSAVKLDGKRAYALARSGAELDMPIRSTQISAFKVVPGENGEPLSPEAHLSYRCTVSKGTYIRSLSQWVAGQMGTIGYTIQLRREAIGDLSIKQAVVLDKLDTGNWQQYLLPTRQVLSRFTPLDLSEAEAKLVANGGEISTKIDFACSTSLCALYSNTQTLLAIGEVNGNNIHPIVVLR